MKKLKSEMKSAENKISRTLVIFRRIKRSYPNPTTALHYRSALELLVSTILSAQCTDERVNKVTKDLFRKYKTAKDYVATNPLLFEQQIKSTGFYHNKAKNIINCCKVLIYKYGGNVPDSLIDLVQLPGVGRKTANVILGNYFHKPEGIVVDTHVKRLSERLGLTSQSNPEKIEVDLMKIIPKKYWISAGNLLILHGRQICQARKPKCHDCVINDLCPSVNET